MHFTSIIITALIATARAVQINTPASGATVDVSHSWTVAWTSVNTDPSQICLYLSNFASYPPQTIFLYGPVTTSSGSATIPGQCYSGLRNTADYRVRATQCYDPNTIYAESGQFRPTQPSCAARRDGTINLDE